MFNCRYNDLRIKAKITLALFRKINEAMSTMQVKLQSQTETESAASCASVPAATSAPEFHRERSEAASLTSMNWNAIKKFNFTYAIPGGAWLEDVTGNCNWYSFSFIEKQLGRIWIDRQLKKQGWMTGCWIEAC